MENKQKERLPFLEKMLDGAKVNFKALGDCANIVRGRRVTKRELGSTKEFPVYSGGVTPMGYFEKSNQSADTITVVKYGTAGFVNFITEDFWANDVCYCVSPSGQLNNKFLFYFLKGNQSKIEALATDAIPAHLPTQEISNIQIPIPPLKVQEKIVGILDKFTELTAELTTELTAEIALRKKQYEYYREQLLTF